VEDDAAESRRAVRMTLPPGAAGRRRREDEAVRARDLGVVGWTREGEAGEVRLHVEGPSSAVEELVDLLAEDEPREAVGVEEVRPEGHEQFAVRGVPAGRFEVLALSGRGGWELRLEVGGELRRWAVPRGPSMDPADKRMAIELEAAAEPSTSADPWDRGEYEQGGRVPWPEAIARGHAVFVLHGDRLEGGFALQRTGGGPKPKWLLIKRRDEHAVRRGERANAPS
jgi:acylphosphatase